MLKTIHVMTDSEFTDRYKVIVCSEDQRAEHGIRATEHNYRSNKEVMKIVAETLGIFDY